MTRRDAHAQAMAKLSHLEDPRAEALHLLFACEGIDRTEWMIRPDEAVLRPDQFFDWLNRRTQGHSLASLCGVAGFMGFDVAVGPGVLVPRGDTETFAQISFGDGPIVDLGTGSGVLARWAQLAQPAEPVVAVEYAYQALSYARRNLFNLPVSLVRGSGLGAFADQCLGTILSNPPYIDAAEPELDGDGVRFEPDSALVADDGGMADIVVICEQASRCLKPGGWIWIEHGYRQHHLVQQQLHRVGLVDIKTLADLAGHPRVTGGRR